MLVKLTNPKMSNNRLKSTVVINPDDISRIVDDAAVGGFSKIIFKDGKL